MFSVTKNGKPLDPSLYIWDEKTKTFSTNEHGLVLDFSGYNGVTFRTGNSCTFNTGGYTGYYCTFNTGGYCNFNTGGYCTFKTGSGCAFNTGYSCTFTTGSDCTFTTGFDCTFHTGSDCTFQTGPNCTFTTGNNCFITRSDVNCCTEIPEGKTIKLNGYEVNGYTIIEEPQEKSPSCAGKVVEIDGKKYKLVETA